MPVRIACSCSGVAPIELQAGAAGLHTLKLISPNGTESNAFQFLEGVMLCAYGVQANAAYIYLRGEFWQLADFLDEKIAEMDEVVRRHSQKVHE